VLSLAVRREHGCETVRCADFGVTDYAAPLVGPAFPSNPREASAFEKAIFAALSGYDLVRFERLPKFVNGRPNPLALQSAAVSSRMSGHVISIAEDVPSYIASLGAKFRREVDRCRRHVAMAGPLRIVRASDDATALADFATLETFQAARWTGAMLNYRLGEPAYARFYRDVIERGRASGFAEVLTLRAGDAFVGAVFGIRSADTITFLRIACDDERWTRFSPGRLTFLAAFEHFVAQGVRVFDLGIGDYDYKRRLGADPVPLVDVTAPVSWTGAPLATGIRAKAYLGRQPALKRFADRLRGRG
jgi:CelD/BcsL family acetyltransferase involved in cellulose biosynthesis